MIMDGLERTCQIRRRALRLDHRSQGINEVRVFADTGKVA